MDVKKMETLVKFSDIVKEKEYYEGYRDFILDFSKGYIEIEFLEKQKQLTEYISSYDQLDDKESFHAQYLLSLIKNLNTEI